jgi:hypothetical protein
MEDQYNYVMAKYDPIDMTGHLEDEILCKSLFDMVSSLRDHGKDTMSEVIRYSYILSMT